MTRTHVPVLAGELIELLDPHVGETAIDCTFGDGGHARLVAGRIGPAGMLVCVDRDPAAEERFEAFAREVECDTRFMRMDYADALERLLEEGIEADMVYLDLGISSMQIDAWERGFSYSYDAPLDMRMDPGQELDARQVVNEWDERRLAQLFSSYGEERFARQIARAIARRRAKAPIETTNELVDTIKGAVPAPAGPQTVVLAPGWSGILLHEAVGHGLEADFIRKGTSLFAGKLGEKVASELVTVIDDGTVAGGRGSLNVDDEGNPGERKVLIEKGVLKGYLYDHLNAKLTGQRSTGSGRRQSFRHAPMPRMTNTYLAPGDQTPEEILRGVPKGLYCRQFGGGQVDISNGNFVFEISEAYLIEEGEITRPVKGAMLIGVGPEALKNVSAVGSDASLDPGLGTCGKDGQSVPVGVGLPTVRIDNVTVGGTGA